MMLMLSGCIGEIVTAGQQQRHLEATDDQVMMARLLAQSTQRAPVGLSAPAGGLDGGLERGVGWKALHRQHRCRKCSCGSMGALLSCKDAYIGGKCVKALVQVDDCLPFRQARRGSATGYVSTALYKTPFGRPLTSSTSRGAALRTRSLVEEEESGAAEWYFVEGYGARAPPLGPSCVVGRSCVPWRVSGRCEPAEERACTYNQLLRCTDDTTPAHLRLDGPYWQDEGRIGEARVPGPTSGIDDPDAASDTDGCDDIGAQCSYDPFSLSEAGLCGAINGVLARSIEQRSFFPDTTFRNARPGYVFKTGPLGVCYYRDTYRVGATTVRWCMVLVWCDSRSQWSSLSRNF